jgi:hypothetical protein
VRTALVCLALIGGLAAAAPAGASPSPYRIQAQACRTCVAQGVVDMAPNNAWIVGFRGAYGKYDTWIRHWNGHRWKNVAAPSPGPSNELFGVDGTSSSDVWAVGWYYRGQTAQSLLEHWDGASWSAVPGPLSVSAPLYDVSMLSANDAWAVGSQLTENGQRTLTLHWDGSSWAAVPSPNPAGGKNIRLNKVSAVSADDVWALGSYRDSGGTLRSYLLHWDGGSWSEESTTTQSLQDVSGDATADAWAVGTSGGDETVTEHWDGGSWSRISSPNPGGGPAHVLRAVDARTPTDSWAAGFFDTQSTDAAMILHWDGSSWTDAGAPTPVDSYLYGISASTETDAWAIGDTTGGTGKAHLLLMHWDGSSWTEV